MRGVLGIGSFRRLLVASAGNTLAWAVADLALSLLIYRETHSAWATTGFFIVSQLLPACVAPRIVATVQRWGTRRVLTGTYAAEAIIFLPLALSAHRFSLPLVLVLIFLGGCVALIAQPILRAETAALTAPLSLLREANAVLNTAFALAILIGPLLGSLLIALIGVSTSMLVLSGIFAGLALVVTLARGLGSPESTAAEPGGRTRAVLRYIRGDGPVRRLLAFQTVALVFFTVSVPIEVVLAEHVLHAGATGYGALMSAWGGGAVLGSAAYARWRRLPGWVIMAFGAACIGVGYLLMAVAPGIALAIVGAAIGGVGNGAELVAERTTLQECLPERWMTLVLAVNESIMWAVPGLGFLLGGALTALGGSRWAFGVGGVGALLLAFSAPVFLRDGGVPSEPRSDGPEVVGVGGDAPGAVELPSTAPQEVPPAAPEAQVRGLVVD